MFGPVLAFVAVQLVTSALYTFILSRYIHKEPLLMWLTTRHGPASITEMLVTLVLFLIGVVGSVAAGILTM